MASLAANQRASLVVVDADSATLNDTQFGAESSDPAIASIEGVLGGVDVVGQAEGECDVTVTGTGTHAGQTGRVHVTVTAAGDTLVVTLGTARPK